MRHLVPAIIIGALAGSLLVASPAAGDAWVDGHGRRSEVIDLSGPSAKRVVVQVPRWHRKQVRIRVVSSGRPVLIDGLAVYLFATGR